MIRYTLIFLLSMFLLLSCTKQITNYQTIHKKAIVVDLHSDTPLRMKDGFDFAVRDTSGHMDIPRLIEGGVDLQVFACFISTNEPADSCCIIVDELIDTLIAQIDRNPDKIEICTTAKDAERIINSGKIAGFIGIENGVAIENNLENINHFYDRGVRYLSLTHTSSSEWVESSADTSGTIDGLTDFGIDVVKRMNELGMIIDISHSSSKAVEKILAHTTDPVIASHSCVHAICPHDRNLTDEQINAVAKNGGMIGINFYSGYLAPENSWSLMSDSISDAHRDEIDSLKELYKDDRRSLYKAYRAFFPSSEERNQLLGIDIGLLVDHIDHIVKLVGADYVGLGSDFDGVPAMPIGLDDCSTVPLITKELVKRDYSTDDINKILGGNFMRVFKAVCD